MTQDHLCKMQRYVARVAITPSVFRGQSPPGFVSAAREFLANLDLTPLANIDVSEYPKWLDEKTHALMAKFPVKDRWGHARKSINIFTTMASLNRFLCEVYALQRLENALEVPLDNEVERKLRKFARNHKELFAKGQFPTWNTITALDSTNSKKYQQIAQAMAEDLRIPRARLDVMLWEATEG